MASEDRFQWLAVAVITVVGVTLGAGVVFYVAAPGARLTALILHAGLLLLMTTPAIRLSIAVVQATQRRDWTFVIMVAVVVLELAIVMWRAAHSSNL